MKLNITGLEAEAQSLIRPGADGTYAHIGARGGTEMMAARIVAELDPELRKKFNIIHSRFRQDMLAKDRDNILVLHDTWDDPESAILEKPEIRSMFAKLVFVSNFQQATFAMGRGVPYADCVVIQNAIDPIPVNWEDKKSSILKIVYHTTPHRGLEILVPVFEHLAKINNNIHLDVFSSFSIYGWKQRDKPYEKLFDRIRNHPNMTYHGYKPNEVVREHLAKAHIFAYPNIWPETSCIAAIEAMSAGLQIVCPNFGALPETTANFANMYPFHENPDEHANLFANALYNSINAHWSEHMQSKLRFQKVYTDNFYGWNGRAAQWNAFLKSL